MSGFTESGMTLDFPDANYFRLQDCTGYKNISGFHFKEMDVCWYDTEKNIYWLIELKDFRVATLNPSTQETRVWDMVKKAVDSLMMFKCVQHGYPYASTFSCMQPLPIPVTQLNIITIVNCQPTQKPDVQLMNDVFKQKFQGYAKLFDIARLSVMSYDSAKKHLPFVT